MKVIESRGSFMHKINVRFLLMGLFFFLYGMLRRSPVILVAGSAFLLYAFFSKSMVQPKENIFKPKLRLNAKTSKSGKKNKGKWRAIRWRATN